MNPTQADLEASLRKSFSVIQQLKRQLAESAERAQEPIAVVGMSCRFPGGVTTPEAFWELLVNGTDTVREIPTERWDWQQFYDADPDRVGTHYVRHGSFVDDVSQFDPEFFGIAGREADMLDPQHRLLLEVSWEALERAGLATANLRNSRTGVYVGIGQNDYSQLQLYNGDHARITPYDGTGGSFCFASARISYLLGLQGPNMAVDTACSSSLVSLHLACQALRNGECEQALAGGVHLVVTPEVTIYLSRLKALSPDGRCKTFSDDADGYGRGEGCGMLVLKRLSDAKRDGDQILALLRGSAVNHDGPSSGLTVPNGLAQQQLLRDTISRAGLTPADIGWIEAHGTGTSLGDPIEVGALAEVFPKASRNEQPLYLSSVKTNIGHLEAAAGIAGVIKVILALQHAALPPHRNLSALSSHIDWANLPFHIPTTLTPWADNGKPRIAGVSAFGLGGTNAHVLVSAAPNPASVEEAPTSSPALPLLLSAKTPAALDALRQRYIALLATTPTPWSAIARTAALGRRQFDYRLAVAADSREAALEQLRSRDGNTAQLNDAPSKIAFIFTGQGAQYIGMGRALLSNAVFRDALQHCASLVEREAGWSPLQFIDSHADDERIDQTGYTQPTLFTLQYALVCLWRACGIEPSVVLGHSVGEIAAAWTAGVLSLEDAVRLVVQRGRLMQALPAGTGMAALTASEASAKTAIADFPGQLWIAALNAPNATVIAGDNAALDRCLAQLDARGITSRRLPVSHAFHTPRMQAMLASFRQTASSIAWSAPHLPVLLTGSIDSQANAMATPEYWVQQVAEPVRFAAAASRLLTQSPDVVLEIGPSGGLLALAQQSGDDSSALWLASLSRRDAHTTATSLAKLFERGCDIQWTAIFGPRGTPALLPTYPFQRRHCWVPAAAPSSKRAYRSDGSHPLLGNRLPSALGDKLYLATINAHAPALLADHVVNGDVIFPAAAFIEAALEAACQHFGGTALRLSDIQLQRPLLLPEASNVRLQLALTPGSGDCQIRIFSQPESASDGWIEHIQCRAEPLIADTLAPAFNGAGLVANASQDGERFYAESTARGIAYGPAFQALQSLRTLGDGRGAADFAVSALGANPYRLHPVILDAALQALAAARPDLRDRAFIPAAIASLEWQAGASLLGSVLVQMEGEASSSAINAALSIADANGSTRVRLSGIRMQQVGSAATQASTLIWQPHWQAVPTAASAGLSGHWLLVDGDALPAFAPVLQPAVATLTNIRSSEDVSTYRKQIADAIEQHGELSGVCYLALKPAASATPCLAELALLQTLGELSEAHQPRLLFVTRASQVVLPGADLPAPDHAPLWGLARVARNEYPRLRVGILDLDAASSADEHQHIIATLASDDEDQLALRDGSRYALRLQAASSTAPAARPVPSRLVCTTLGDLDSLQFQPLVDIPLAAHEVRIRVRAAGLNFKDVLHALGVLPMPADSGFGFDGAGTVEALGAAVTDLQLGQRVMFTLTPASIADTVNAHRAFVTTIPAALTWAEAAGVPLAFLTAWHALVNVAQLRAGERVLIHSGAGGVGQAALQIARWLKAEVVTSASQPKHAFLQQQGFSRIYNSRSTAFSQQLRADLPAGVDVVLNALNGDFIAASFDCLARGGRFVEIGKAGIWSDTAAQAYRADVRYTAFDLADVARAEPAQIQAMFRTLAQHFADGNLQAIPVHCYPASDSIAAFRLLSRAKQTGKVVITLPRPATPPQQGIHLISGGFGALARSLVDHLLAQGVRHIALLARSAPTGERSDWLTSVRASGANIEVYSADLADQTAVTNAIARAEADAQTGIVAVYHTAGVLADAAISNQSAASFASVAAPKLQGAWRLHQATRQCDLHSFVLFSSAAALLGTPGQSSYATANTGLDALAHARQAAGLPALSINWGPWGEIGMAARLSDIDQQRMTSAGITPLNVNQAWAAMASLQASSTAQALVMPVDWAKLSLSLGGTTPSILRNLQQTSAENPQTSSSNLLSKISALPANERRPALQRELQQRIATILGRPNPSDIRLNQGFFAIGMDSLTSVELRNRLQKELACKLPATLAFDYGSVEALGDYLLGMVGAWQVVEVAAEVATEEFAGMSEVELAELLVRELGG